MNDIENDRGNDSDVGCVTVKHEHTGWDQRTSNSSSACQRVNFNGDGPCNYQRLAALLLGCLQVADPDTFCFKVRVTGGVSSVTPLNQLSSLGSTAFTVLGTFSVKFLFFPPSVPISFLWDIWLCLYLTAQSNLHIPTLPILTFLPLTSTQVLWIFAQTNPPGIVTVFERPYG